ncbi:alpha/beta hydrolase [Solwaraspora sp. WMMB335]|uniref:alpha/beta hydrolase n=1 Tax=Solwaraspora sp. WMMB335 TaxID=3404118 RepID=UPI003B95F12F
MQPDILGPPYEQQVIELDPDDEGPVVATLVRRRADRPAGRAVLYLHGFGDYFFQTHLADHFIHDGWDFYALDLRKYGRSLLPHQTPNFCRDISEYFPELDAAARIIRRDGNETLLVNGHSTGGLIAAIWSDARAGQDVALDGLFLNSPFFDLNLPWLLRRPLAAAVCRLNARTPYRVVQTGLSSVYGQSVHDSYQGEWNFDLDWKPLAGFPVRAGWLNAIRQAQRRLRHGLRITVPVLLACSTRSFRSRRWHDAATLADAVLDVEHMVRWAPRLGRHVTLVRIDGGLHDLTLSGKPARDQLFSELDRWLRAYFTSEPTGPDPGQPVAAERPENRGIPQTD